MSKKTLQALAIALAVSLVALGSFAAGTSARMAGAVDGEESGGSNDSVFHRLHAVANNLHGGLHRGFHGHHGGGGGHGAGDFRAFVESLDLSPEQAERLDAIHGSLGSLGARSGGSMTELHDRLMGQFEAGNIEIDSVRPMIDQHLDEIRTVAYSTMDELVALMNSLDAGQRDIVLEHVRAAQGVDNSGEAY